LARLAEQVTERYRANALQLRLFSMPDQHAHRPHAMPPLFESCRFRLPQV
jgi:hypothetical protein